MTPSLRTFAEAIAGKRDISCSTQECIQLINETSATMLEKNEMIADSILNSLIAGFIALSNKGDATAVLNLVKFFLKANKNDKWLVAGGSQVLPYLHQFSCALLSDFGNLMTCSSGGKIDSLRIRFTAKERIELGAQFFELSVDYCDVLSKNSEKHLGLLANMAVEFIFEKSDNRRTEEDRGFSCAVDSLKRSASFAVANVVESFPGTIPGIFKSVKSRRKELIRLMVQSSEASIQRSIIRIVSILYKCKKNGRFGYPEIRNTVSAFLRKGGKKSQASESVLRKFQQIDVMRDDSVLQVENFRRTAVEHLEYDSCLTTTCCKVCIMDANSASENSFSGASVDWDENSFSVQHEALSPLRVPWHHVLYVEWNKAGNEVTIYASRSLLKWIRITFSSKRFESNSAAQEVCHRLQQYRFLLISCDMEIEAELRTPRKMSNSQTFRGESTPSIASPIPHSPGIDKFELPVQIDDTIFAGLPGDGILLPKENKTNLPALNAHEDVIIDPHSASGETAPESASRRVQTLDPCPISSVKQTTRPDTIDLQTTSEAVAKNDFWQGNLKLSAFASARKKWKLDNCPAPKHGSRHDELLKNSDVNNEKKTLDVLSHNPKVSPNGVHEVQSVPCDARQRILRSGCNIDDNEAIPLALTSPQEFASAKISFAYDEASNPRENISVAVAEQPSRATKEFEENSNDYSSASSSQSFSEDDLNEAAKLHEEAAFSVSQKGPLNEKKTTGARVELQAAPNVPGATCNGVDICEFDDDNGREFVSKLLQVIESALKRRKQRTRALIERTRKKAARIRQQGAEVRKEARATFTNLMKEKLAQYRVRIADRGVELTRGLEIQLHNVGKIQNKKVALENEKTKVQKTAVQQIGDSKKQLTVTQNRMAASLRSAYETNKHRRQSLQKSDNLLREISGLLMTNEVQ